MKKRKISRERWRRYPGFSLIELLVVIAVTGILITLIIPVIGTVRERGYAVKSASNLRQIHGAVMHYANDHKGRIPGAAEVEDGNFSGNFWLTMEDAGYIELFAWNSPGGGNYMFNPAALAKRQPTASALASYAVNYFASGGLVWDGELRQENVLGSVQRMSGNPGRQAMIMDGAWNGST